MANLVIKEWTASNQPLDDEGAYVRIHGRQGGLIAWILALLKVDPTTKINVFSTRVEFTSASLAGTDHKLIPIQNVCSTNFGYYKPWKKTLALFIALSSIGNAILSGIFSSEGELIIMLNHVSCVIVSAIVSIVYYALNKTMSLGFVEHSGLRSHIRFKRSVIEGQSIDESQAQHITEIIHWLIESARIRE